MSVVFYRIDDRLVHGQIMTAWSKIHNATNVIIVDPLTAKNPFLVQVLQMAVPSGFTVSVVDAVEGAKLIKEDPPTRKSLVLTKTPSEMQNLIDQGVEIKELNVGGMGSQPGRKAITRGVLVTKDELVQLQKMAANGVHVYAQSVPEIKRIEINESTKL